MQPQHQGVTAMPIYKLEYMLKKSTNVLKTTIAARNASSAKKQLKISEPWATSISASLAEPSTRRVNKKRVSDKKSGLRRKEFLVTDSENDYLKICLDTYRNG